ncbi:PD-(D/E)XK motif protein [Pseudomonas kilonensis]|uniref:PD-(D/E)XK motif protein n=1 Tax=Pseudomonas kilonensis TaxID=132476 RepID=UPI00069E2DA7|nr:PD-(D/E)XK motif protein [Pseudomonas kilonensis]
MNNRPIDRWKRLRETGTGDGVIEVPSIDSGVATGFGTARYAIGGQGQPRLLVPIGGMNSIKSLASTTKLSVTTSSFKLSGKGILFIDIMSLDRALDSVFAELAENILRRIGDGVAPLISVTETIEDFRELLREHSRADVPDRKIIGVVGELYILQVLTKYNLTAVEAWVGPYEMRHDFRRHIHALEVKTSGRSDAKSVLIHGIDQLQAPKGGTLLLAHVRMERAENGLFFVGELFDTLVKLGVDGSSLLQRLAALDCPDPHAREWNRLSFTLEGLKVYSVEDGFPRVIGASFNVGSLPQGIAAIEYQVDLGHAVSFELSAADYDFAFRRIAG